jgi:hypothetical protein
MTTPLTRNVAREVVRAGTKPLIVTLTLAGVQFRVKGTRTSYLLPYGVAYTRAAHLEADQMIRSRRARRRVSRGLLATEARS